MSSSNSSPLTTDFNVPPYYDDYDANKQYYRILYVPGRAVQGRELTQMQTILQKQINRFGMHVFKEGSIVIPGSFSLETGNGINSISYVKVKDVDNSNTSINIDDFSGDVVRSANTNVTAQIIEVAAGSEGVTNTKTIFVRYTSASNSNNSIKTFQAGETLVSGNAGNLVVLSNDPVANTGYSSRFKIDEGVVFAKEHFIYFPTQSVILSRYNSSPTCKVGFYITEEIISYLDDISLLDPALESSNYSAPGADRLKLATTLSVLDYTDDAGAPDFVTLFTIKDGIIQTTYERSQYNILQDELAKRTYDESGDYYVKGLDVHIREHDDTGSNFGKYASGNNQLLYVGVEPGVGYVKGYEVGLLSQYGLSTEKGLTYSNVASQIAAATIGSYIQVNEMTGALELDKGTLVNLYDTAQDRITSKGWSTASQTGSNIGTAAATSIEYVSGTPGYDAIYNLFLTDIRMTGSNNFANVRSVYLNNSAVADFGADIVLDAVSNNAVLNDTSDYPLLYYVGSNATKTIRDSVNTSTPDTSFSFNRSEGISTPITVASGGTFAVTLSAGTETFPYGATTLTSLQKKELMLTFNQSFNVAMTGTVSGSGTTLTGSGTAFTRLNVGDKITIAGKSNTIYISAIANATSLTTSETLPAGLSGNSFFKAYKTGDIIDLTGKGCDAGTTRSVTATSTVLTFDLKETYPATVDATLNYRLTRSAAKETPKSLRHNYFVKVNCAAISDLTQPINLGISDVISINSIRKSTSSFPTSNTDGTDVKSQFLFDDGQRDTHYDHAAITSITGLVATDRLLVELDFFEPDFTSYVGYFSVDSYPVEDDDNLFSASTKIRTEDIPIFKSPTTGREYDLRNYFDFRPIKTNTAAKTTVPASASINPSTTTTFSYNANGMRYPVPSSQITYDYMFYLGRKDLVVVDKDKNFYIIKGVPSAYPVTPPATDNVMVLAVLDIPPYPSLSPAYGASIERKDLAAKSRKVSNIRFTMRDIGVLKERIVNLEYYASLSLLEKSAIDMKITDENGLDRFKNGIFVDTFSDHSLGATYSADYKIVVDPIEKSIRPLYTMESFGYNYISGSNIRRTGDLITLDYTETELLSQTAATSYRNVERSSYLFNGRLTVSPEDDVWVDTVYGPDEGIQLGTDAALMEQTRSGLTTEWGAWQRHVAGYNVYTSNGQMVGNYATEGEARSAADFYRSNFDVTIETVTASSRVGNEKFLAGTDTTTQQGSGKVIDTSLIPYIRPQTLTIKATAMKPHSKLYVYFDGEDMSSYSTPLTAAEYASYIAGTPPATSLSAEGSSISSDEDGVAYINLRLDSSKRFRVGTKPIIITDSSTNSPDASTIAKGYFVAQGLSQTKQNTIFTTKVPVTGSRSVNDSFVNSTFETLSAIPPPVPPRLDPRDPVIPEPVSQTWPSDVGLDCSAYTFLIKGPQGQEGLFLTSVDLFFKSKSYTKGIWFEIREMDNSGNITKNQVPMSEVFYTSDQVTLSDDGITNPHNVVFPSPVFLYNNVQYAFVIHTESASPDYYFWISRLGENDVNTGLQKTSRPLSGAFFTTNNNVNWDIVPDVDLTCTFYRASFVTETTASVVIGNKPVDKLVITNPVGPMTDTMGALYVSGDRITLSGANGTPVVTDYMIGVSSGANATITYAISGTQFATDNTGFIAGEAINIHAANGAYRKISATLSSNTNVYGTLSKYEESATRIEATLKNSTGGFYANDVIWSYQDGRSYRGTVASVDNYRYSTVDFEPAFLDFNSTSITYSMTSLANACTATTVIDVNPSQNHSYDVEQAIYSRTNEIDDNSGVNSNRVTVSMISYSDRLSPVIDLARTHSIYIDNIINSNTTNETNAAGGGSLFNKYISKTITLNDGQDAEDLQVILTAHRPPGTDVKVWVKILNGEDTGTTLLQRSWIEMEKVDDTLYSSQSDSADFHEYKYVFPTSYLTGSIGEVQYTGTSSTVFTGFKYFAVKVGLTSNNSAIIPRVADLRAIALQI